jgi:hypothetical protein
MAEYNPFSSIYSQTDFGKQASAYPTTENFDISMPDVLSRDLGLSSMPFQSSDARNTAQKSMAQSDSMMRQREDLHSKDYFGQALEAITSLNKRFGVDTSAGIPVPGERGIRQRTSVTGLPYYTFRATPSEYNTIEGRTYTGSQIPKETLSFGISPEMKASQAELPRLNVPAKGLFDTNMD